MKKPVLLIIFLLTAILCLVYWWTTNTGPDKKCTKDEDCIIASAMDGCCARCEIQAINKESQNRTNLGCLARLVIMPCPIWDCFIPSLKQKKAACLMYRCTIVEK
ncbi:MAG: hypothetical protein WCG27_01965 [Pseudomonadota bacterium]